MQGHDCQKLGQTWDWTPGTPTPEGFILASIDWLTVNVPKTSACWHAVEFLAFNPWRVKVCRECGDRYVALKQQSAYCTPACFRGHRKRANRITGKEWWDEKGNAWRHRTKLAKRSKKKHQPRNSASIWHITGLLSGESVEFLESMAIEICKLQTLKGT